MADNSPRILCVDDDVNAVNAMARNLTENFDVSTATGGRAGLQRIDKEKGDFVAVVSDLRMPEMDGITFLRHVEMKAPDTVRILITGDADLQSAVAAVNDGHVFRFLMKPCEELQLQRALQDGVEHHRIMLAERALLEETVTGVISALGRALEMASPDLFSRVEPIKRHVRHMVRALNHPDAWQFEVAAGLAQIGCLSLKPETLQRLANDEALDEQQLLEAEEAPGAAYHLLQSVPRLETVAKMIRDQRQEVDRRAMRDPLSPAHTAAVGSAMLQIAHDLDRMLLQGVSVGRAVLQMKNSPEYYHPKLLNLLADYQIDAPSLGSNVLFVNELNSGMVLLHDVYDLNGNIIAPKGSRLDPTIIDRLQKFAAGVGVEEPIRVK